MAISLRAIAIIVYQLGREYFLSDVIVGPAARPGQAAQPSSSLQLGESMSTDVRGSRLSRRQPVGVQKMLPEMASPLAQEVMTRGALLLAQQDLDKQERALLESCGAIPYDIAEWIGVERLLLSHKLDPAARAQIEKDKNDKFDHGRFFKKRMVLNTEQQILIPQLHTKYIGCEMIL